MFASLICLMLFFVPKISTHDDACVDRHEGICELSIARCERDCLLSKLITSKTDSKKCLVRCLFSPVKECYRISYDECMFHCEAYRSLGSMLENRSLVCDFTCTTLNIAELQTVLNPDNTMRVGYDEGCSPKNSLQLIVLNDDTEKFYQEFYTSDIVNNIIISSLSQLTEIEVLKLISSAFKVLQSAREEVQNLDKMHYVFTLARRELNGKIEELERKCERYIREIQLNNQAGQENN